MFTHLDLSDENWPIRLVSSGFIRRFFKFPSHGEHYICFRLRVKLRKLQNFSTSFWRRRVSGRIPNFQLGLGTLLYVRLDLLTVLD